MAKIWRWIVPIAAAGGLIAMTGTIPAEAANVSTTTISIKAHNQDAKYPNITGDTVVWFGYKGLQDATISGTVSGAASGDVVTLLAEPFRATHFTAVGTPVTLTSATQSYSFSVRPALETKYKAQVTTGSAIDATSKVQPVYVTIIQVTNKNSYGGKCGRTACTLTIKTRTVVPASAYGTETHKRWYFYLGVNRSNRAPSDKAPKYLGLWKAWKASKAKRVSATAFQVTFTYKVQFDGKKFLRPFPAYCTKDAVTKDGIGLPGHHGCGAKRIRSNITYLG